MRRRDFLTLMGTAASLAARPPARWRAGVAAVDITPAPGIWMGGYSLRKCAAEGVGLALHAKALALADEAGARAVLVTLDLLGVTASMVARVADTVRRRYGVAREALLINASHTHSGPVTSDMLSVAYDLTPERLAAIDTYTQRLERRITDVIGEALHHLRPAALAVGEGRARFAANRRVQYTPDGPVDHAVPVLEVSERSGRPRAIVFGYACHNTTLQDDNCRLHSDYAGVAQVALERRHPGARALFVAGCGGDANPKPRGTVELAERHGTELADAVDGARGSLVPVSGPLRAAYGVVDLPFAPVPGREAWEARLEGADVYVRRHARLMLDALDRDGRLPHVQPEPVQVWRCGAGLTLVALGGEVVVDYALRLKRDYPDQRLWVAAYSNDVFGYVPSLRVLREGGYEAGGAMIYYGRPGPFAEPVEELIHGKIRELMDGGRA